MTEVVNLEAGWVPRILAVPDGLVFWRENMAGFWFVSKQELEAFASRKRK